MKSFNIEGKLRKDVGKTSTKKLRNEGFVPCEMYGGKENVHFYVEEKQFKKLIYTPNIYIINLDVEGKKYNAIIQNCQFHPVSEEILHADLIEINDNKNVSIKIPVKITGNSIGVRNGGKLRLAKRNIKVTGLPKDLPDTLEIDITNLNIGDSVKVKDLSFNNLELIDPQNAMVVGVISSRLAKAGAEEEEAEAAEATEEAGAEAGAEESAEGSKE